MSKKFDVPVIRFNVHLTVEDIDDIVCTALEGGINYWACSAEVPADCRVADWGHEQIARGGKLLIHVDEPFDEYDTEVYELNLENFLNGFKIWMNRGGFCSEILENCSGDLDVSCIDADDADSIIQYALFGELVFG